MLIGRDDEARRLKRGIASGGTFPTVEGPTGAGKTSLVSVSAYQLYRQTCVRGSGVLYITLPKTLQLQTSADEFEQSVYREIAQALISHSEDFEHVGLLAPRADFAKWLNSPDYKSSGAQAVGFGLNGGSEPNTSSGFSESGFSRMVKSELGRCFPTEQSGGVICVIDNLELLQTKKAAIGALDDLRDRIFDTTGLRWVLCGSRGLVSHARTQRLSGIFRAPMEIPPIASDVVPKLVRARVNEFATDGCFVPVDEQGFTTIYEAYGENLRDAFATAQEFADDMHDRYFDAKLPYPSADEVRGLLESWLKDRADTAHAAVAVQPRIWQFFEEVGFGGGQVRADAWVEYNFNDQAQMSGAVTALANASLMVRETDPEDASKKVSVFTPQGWLVFFYRSRYNI